jgi:hypothetical protein
MPFTLEQMKTALLNTASPDDFAYRALLEQGTIRDLLALLATKPEQLQKLSALSGSATVIEESDIVEFLKKGGGDAAAQAAFDIDDANALFGADWKTTLPTPAQLFDIAKKSQLDDTPFTPDDLKKINGGKLTINSQSQAAQLARAAQNPLLQSFLWKVGTDKAAWDAVAGTDGVLNDTDFLALDKGNPAGKVELSKAELVAKVGPLGKPDINNPWLDGTPPVTNPPVTNPPQLPPVNGPSLASISNYLWQLGNAVNQVGSYLASMAGTTNGGGSLPGNNSGSILNNGMQNANLMQQQQMMQQQMMQQMMQQQMMQQQQQLMQQQMMNSTNINGGGFMAGGQQPIVINNNTCMHNYYNMPSNSGNSSLLNPPQGTCNNNSILNRPNNNQGNSCYPPRRKSCNPCAC